MSFSVEGGENIAIIGTAASGKSSFIFHDKFSLDIVYRMQASGSLLGETRPAVSASACLLPDSGPCFSSLHAPSGPFVMIMIAVTTTAIPSGWPQAAAAYTTSLTAG